MIRPSIIFNSSIPYWFRQNLFLYVEQEFYKTLPSLANYHEFIPNDFELVSTCVLSKPLGFTEVLKEIKPSLCRAIKNRIKLNI